MKQLLLPILMIATIAISGHAQTRIAPMIGISQRFNDVNLGSNMEFFVNEEISLSPDIIFYLPVNESTIKKDWFEINFNGHYYFYKHGIYEFYGIGGLNYMYSHYKYRYTDVVDTEATFNVNMGGGMNFKLGKYFLPFSEFKYVIGKNNIVIVAGIKFTL